MSVYKEWKVREVIQKIHHVFIVRESGEYSFVERNLSSSEFNEEIIDMNTLLVLFVLQQEAVHPFRTNHTTQKVRIVHTVHMYVKEITQRNNFLRESQEQSESLQVDPLV